MAVVTDPKILAELNGNMAQETGGVVTDPELLKQLNAQPQKPVPSIINGIAKSVFGVGQKLGYSPEQILQGINKLANHPATNVALGFGDANRNMLADTANIIPGVNIDRVTSGSGDAYDLGKLGGEVAGYVGAGSGLKTLTKLAALKNAGMIGKGAQALLNNPGMTRIAGSTAYGAITNPDDRLVGGAIGGALGAGAEAIPYATRLIGKPKESAKAIQEYINSEHGRASSMYDEIKKGAKDLGEIYKTEFPMYGGAKKVYGQYKAVNPEVFSLTKDIEKAHKAFVNKPNYENAHYLQSLLGDELGSYKKANVITPADKTNINKLSNARKAIRADMLSHLDRTAPELANKYREASDIYKGIIDPKRLLEKYRNPGVKEVAAELNKVNDKTRFSMPTPELQKKIHQLNLDRNLQRAAMLGTLGIAGIGHGANLLEGAIAGKLLGLKAPPGLVDATHTLFKGVGQGARNVGTTLKAILPPEFGDING